MCEETEAWWGAKPHRGLMVKLSCELRPVLVPWLPRADKQAWGHRVNVQTGHVCTSGSPTATLPWPDRVSGCTQRFALTVRHVAEQVV